MHKFVNVNKRIILRLFLKTRVFSAYIKEVDGEKPAATPWGAKLPAFGQLMTEYSSGGGSML